MCTGNERSTDCAKIYCIDALVQTDTLADCDRHAVPCAVASLLKDSWVVLMPFLSSHFRLIASCLVLGTADTGGEQVCEHSRTRGALS